MSLAMFFCGGKTRGGFRADPFGTIGEACEGVTIPGASRSRHKKGEGVTYFPEMGEVWGLNGARWLKE